MEGVNTDSLRALATKWSLAGDDQLLILLQSTHQKLISKCQDVNSKLEVMASSLDDASIHLQNVNNKFMALSNSQFIESRVYDDDTDDTTATHTIKESPQSPQPAATDDITMLKRTLATLERAHHVAEILDDSDSDSDAEISVVLKAKDPYSHRPLPHIIGTLPWRNKWHAGLIAEDSDTDSSTSKRDRDIEQYSDSEEEMRPPLEERPITRYLSESSASLPSLVGAPAPPPPPPGAPPAAALRPADIAAALALRLAGDSDTIIQEEPEDPPPAPAQHRKVYKPEKPATSAIFSDEPPPLDAGAASDHSSDEDIFAEINKHTPYTQRNKVQSELVEDLFSFDKPAVEQGDIFSDFAPTRIDTQSVKPNSTLFEGDSEPELFAEPPSQRKIQNKTIHKDEVNIKKPVGGISLFGSNKGAESIGASILKRNQRKSSSSGDESGSDVIERTENIEKQIPENKPKLIARHYEKSEPRSITSKTEDETDNQLMHKNEKDIFDDIFSKTENIQQKYPKVVKETVKVTPVKEKGSTDKEKEKTNVKDLFSDNIFDDIDDIFTSNVKVPTKKSSQKSIFDDDDLFSDIDIAKPTSQSKDNRESVNYTEASLKDHKASIKDAKANVKVIKKGNKETKSIFDSDDELFSDINTDTDKPVAKNIESHLVKDKLINDTKILNINSEAITKIEDIKKPTETIKERNLFDDSPQIVKPDPKMQTKPIGIFDSDSDDDIFAKVKTSNDRKTNEAGNVFKSSKNDNKIVDKEHLSNAVSNDNNKLLTTENIKGKDLHQSPLVFEEDKIDDLFIAANNLKIESNENKDIKVAEVKNIPFIEIEPKIENVSKTNETDNTSPKLEKKEDENILEILKEPSLDERNKKDPNQDADSHKNDHLLEDDLFTTPNEAWKCKASEKVSEISEVIESSRGVSESKAIKSVTRTIIETGVGNTTNIQIETVTDKHKTKNPDEEDFSQPVVDDIIKPANKKETITTEPKMPVLNTGVFDDIFTEPPTFEKFAEPKKSKNVNALFDDDSDDESLFFKKDEVISDEKPEVFTVNANFDIFVDEPPAIDVDFTTKPAKNTDFDDELFSTVSKTDNLIQSAKVANDDIDIFSPVPEKTKSVSKLADDVDNENGDDLFSFVPKVDKETTEMCISEELNFVPEMADEVPNNVKEEKTADDMLIVKNEVSKSQPHSIIFEINDNKDLFSPGIDTNTNNVILNKPSVLDYKIDSDDELFANLPNKPKSSQTKALKSDPNEAESNVVKYKNTEEFDDIFKSESPKKDTEIKKVGKLNTKNFNINVNALIPGASPKKIPKARKYDQKSDLEEPFTSIMIPNDSDFEPKLTSSKGEIDITVKSINTDKLSPDETDKTKYISFIDKNEATDLQKSKKAKSLKLDEQSESGVLDNNVSKQRPRIQVKRRPSSRKARHEAVRKSAIDIADDTDNSSSFDEPKPRKDNNDPSKEDNFNKEDTTSEQNKNIIKDEIKEHSIDNKDDTILSKELKPIIKPVTRNSDRDDTIEISKENITRKEDSAHEKPDIFESTSVPSLGNPKPASSSNETKETRQYLPQIFNENKHTTTKVVYILNDEDIFNTDSKNTGHSKNLLKLKDSESTDIFKGTEGIKTYKGTEKANKEEPLPKLPISNQQENISTKEVESSKTTKASLFGDSDEELFEKNKSTNKTTIFDSDSEEDLFSGKKSAEKQSKEVRNKEVKEKKFVKGSLFGDDDDDDLFGLKKDKEPKYQSLATSTSKETSALAATVSKSAEPVFDDPLSMLRDDD